MTDELDFQGTKLISSKRAAETTGYAQDYIGQLARKGLIRAERVGNLWYVSLDSLLAYKGNAEVYFPQQPVNQSRDADSLISFDGKDYISAARGAKITGYNADYIGQLARAGKILSRQIGKRWYVDREALVAHKREKDSLLAAVQSEAVGLSRLGTSKAPIEAKEASFAPASHFRYFRDDRELLPIVRASDAKSSSHMLDLKTMEPAFALRTMPQKPVEVHTSVPPASAPPKKPPAFTFYTGAKAAAALTVVIMIAYGMTTLKDEAILALQRVQIPNSSIVSSSSGVAAAAGALNSVGDILESIIAPELHYVRE